MDQPKDALINDILWFYTELAIFQLHHGASRSDFCDCYLAVLRHRVTGIGQSLYSSCLTGLWSYKSWFARFRYYIHSFPLQHTLHLSCRTETVLFSFFIYLVLSWFVSFWKLGFAEDDTNAPILVHVYKMQYSWWTGKVRCHHPVQIRSPQD